MGGADVKALNPRTGEPEYDFAETTRTEIAAEAARLRVMQTGWEALGPEGRAAVLLRLADAMEAAAGGIAGLLLSYHAELPSGPCIVLACGLLYLASLFLGARDGLLRHHLRASMPRRA